MSSLNNPSVSDSSQDTTSISTSHVEKENQSPQVIKLAPSMWLRAMTDFDAPFGHDGLPTVWG